MGQWLVQPARGEKEQNHSAQQRSAFKADRPGMQSLKLCLYRRRGRRYPQQSDRRQHGALRDQREANHEQCQQVRGSPCLRCSLRQLREPQRSHQIDHPAGKPNPVQLPQRLADDGAAQLPVSHQIKNARRFNGSKKNNAANPDGKREQQEEFEEGHSEKLNYRNILLAEHGRDAPCHTNN